MNCTTRQAVGVWDELVSAYYGDNRYGGDTAEIYSYRLEEYCPSYHKCRGQVPDAFIEVAIKIVKDAANSLLEIMNLFREKYDCEIFVYKEPLDEWAKTLSRYDRYHVKIIKK